MTTQTAKQIAPTVSLLTASLADNKYTTTKKDRDKMIGTVSVNGVVTNFTLRYSEDNYSKDNYSKDEVEKRFTDNDYTDVIINENKQRWFVKSYQIFLEGIDIKMMKQIGVKFDFTDLYGELLKLRTEDKILSNQIWIAEKTKQYNESWFVNNLDSIQKAIPVGVVVTIDPEKEKYIDPENKYSSAITYLVDMEHNGVVKRLIVSPKYSSSRSYINRNTSLSGYQLSSGGDYLGLFKSADGLVKKLKNIYQDFKYEIDKKKQIAQIKNSELEYLQKNISKEIIIKKETKYSDSGNGKRYNKPYEVSHYEAVFNITTKKNKYSSYTDHFGTGVKFHYDADVKTFKIISIAGVIGNPLEYTNFVNIFTSNLVSFDLSVKLDLFSNLINEEGMRKLIHFVWYNLRSVEMSKYTWTVE